MYLYKAACSDIPAPKQKGAQKAGERGQGPRGGRQSPAGVRLYWGGLKARAALDIKHLEEFLNTHALSLQDSVRSTTGMAYRCPI
ncbi:hypothetical protein AALO_G00197510 [Alosa alosa]|uniref:Uncharacterized protein n=1 Tax=Alosa alosa TaxID=278164 RepID=A0AAV6G698_9TELE|nr:hypothetical protein AALO_G00197510 [Alosa alosa]